VDVFEHGEWQNTLYIAMEYLEGEDLGARLDRVGRLDGAETYRFVAHIARALSRAHAHGIVHRDLKPENVFIVASDEGEIAKVLDFGIAKHDAYSIQDKATRTGSFLGTPYYVSPEQARGKSTDYRSDLWSLGIIAFQCLTGRPPFESEALGELMGLILYEDVPRITARQPDLPIALDAWWERAAARDREQRFQSAKELADSLGFALGLSKVVSVPSIPPRRPSQSDASGSFPPATATGSFPPVSSLKKSGADGLPSFSDPEWVEDRIETDAPVSRTRDSDALGFRGPAWRGLRRLRRFISTAQLARGVLILRELRKRNLVVVAVGGGVLVGVALTWALLSGDPAGTARGGLPDATGRAGASVPIATTGALPLASTHQALPSATAAPGPEATPPATSASGAPVSSAARSPAATAPSGQMKKKGPPVPPVPPRRRVVRGPDYGI
jgi:serine/threonine-protein kinase